MIKRLFLVFALLSAFLVKAQNDQTSSPYSYYGIGLPLFNGTASERSMEGLSILPDSLQLNLINPAGVASTAFTTFSVGLTQRFTNVQSAQDKEQTRNTSFDYFGVAIPAGKLKFSFGIIPTHSVSYKLGEQLENSSSTYSGRGGLNKIFLSFGYPITKNLLVGVEGGLNFGSLKNESIRFQEGIQYGTREKNRSDLSGFSVKIGAQYKRKLYKKINLYTSLSFAPEMKLTAKNTREIATVSSLTDGSLRIISQRNLNLGNNHFNLPTDLRLGAGVGHKEKWFVGASYEYIGKSDYNNTSFTQNNVDFQNGSIARVGGFYTPNNNDITNYFNRITFRAGLRYQDLGMKINNKDINEFGMSFGLGLPAGPYLSNINLGVEYGQRGTTSANLVKENFVNIFIGFSFNDRWFIKRKYH